MALVAFFFAVNLQAMIAGFSFLKRHFDNRPIYHQVIILSDLHALKNDTPIKQTHVHEMNMLIEALTELPNNVPFLIELSERQKDLKLPKSPGNVPIQLALEHHMHYKNISFISFDTRTHCDYWMRDMLLQTQEFTKAIQENLQLPEHFYEVTAKKFLDHIENRYESTQTIIQELPNKEEYSTMSKKWYDVCRRKIEDLLILYRCNNQQHMFQLITKLNQNQKNELYITLLEENTFSIDIILYRHILQLSQDNPTCVIVAGIYHSNKIEKWLLSRDDFAKDNSRSMTIPGTQSDNLSCLKLPKNIPISFIPKFQKTVD